MLPLYDLVLRAQNGAVTEVLARQLDLAPDQVTLALEALIPAFACGLKRATRHSQTVGPLMAMLFSGDHPRYFEDIGKAFTEPGEADGERVLECLFGTRVLSRAIAAEAQHYTGIGEDVLLRMMPALAGAMMGGLFKQATGQLRDAPPVPVVASGEQWMATLGFGKLGSRGAADGARPSLVGTPPPDGPRTDAVAPRAHLDVAESLAHHLSVARPLQDVITRSATAAPATRPVLTVSAPTPASVHGIGGRAGNPLLDVLSTMFDSGLEVHKSYRKSLETLFDRHLGPARTS